MADAFDRYLYERHRRRRLPEMIEATQRKLDGLLQEQARYEQLYPRSVEKFCAIETSRIRADSAKEKEGPAVRKHHRPEPTNAKGPRL